MNQHFGVIDCWRSILWCYCCWLQYIQNAKTNNKKRRTEKKRSASGFNAPSDNNRFVQIQFHRRIAARRWSKKRTRERFAWRSFFVALSQHHLLPPIHSHWITFISANRFSSFFFSFRLFFISNERFAHFSFLPQNQVLPSRFGRIFLTSEGAWKNRMRSIKHDDRLVQVARNFPSSLF